MLTTYLPAITSQLNQLIRRCLNLLGSLPLLNRYLVKPRQRIGRWGESVALQTIARSGLIPLHRNWRASRGELDIIAIDHRTLVIIEVKTRHTSLKRHYAAIQAVHTKKRKMLAKTGYSFARNNGPLCRRLAIRNRRIDAIEVYYSRTRFGFLRVVEVLWHKSLSSATGGPP
jgi:putative endonuclease